MNHRHRDDSSPDIYHQETRFHVPLEAERTRRDAPVPEQQNQFLETNNKQISPQVLAKKAKAN